jgi:ATP-dependent Clp protease ATP-binding subunit ClpA
MNGVLNEKHIAGIISRHSGIPEEKILKTKQESLLELENQINTRVFGQKESINENL